MMRDIAFVVLLPVQNEKRMVLVELSYGLYLKKKQKAKRHGSFFPPPYPQSHFSQRDALQILDACQPDLGVREGHGTNHLECHYGTCARSPGDQGPASTGLGKTGPV